MEGLSGIFNQLANFIIGGGVPTFAVIIVWAIGLGICIERFKKLSFKYDVDGASFMNELQRYVLANDIQGAIRICAGSVAMLPKVLKSGLKRANSSVEQIQNAIDATALEVIPKIEQRLGHLGLLANISTLIGLLGTIQGLISAFSGVSASDPSQKGEFLAKGIAEAMHTTYLGILAAVTLLILHAILSSKAEKIVNEIDEYSVKLLDLLGTKNIKNEGL